jgi:hypothetical protein
MSTHWPINPVPKHCRGKSRLLTMLTVKIVITYKAKYQLLPKVAAQSATLFRHSI